MNEKELEQNNLPGVPENYEPEILVNDYGTTRDPAVVVEEADRTVLLTDNETIIIEKEPYFDIAPKNRPRKIYGGMWDPIAIATAGVAFMAVLTAVLLYIFVVAPSNRELEQNRAERDRLEKELISMREKYGDITSTETQVAKLVASVDDFESRYLPLPVNGRTALYQRINGLIAGYGLVNTTGPDYAPLEIAEQDQGGQSDAERGRSKFQSLFPGVYVTTTVEGPYQNLRRFIREIETGNEFVVISAVELEPLDSEEKSGGQGTAPVRAAGTGSNYPGDPRFGGFSDSNSSQGIQPNLQSQQQARPRGKTHGSNVRLRLEMAAYFRRPSVAPFETTVQ
ncbi:MAG: hypothetical protein M3449_10970 [Acidobacteriota bacterium]|nr:hypothetical protein [Acidobacteriota bacterium]